jgi:methionyl-tRNA synthetase
MAKAKDPALGHCLWCLQSSLWLIARLIDPILPSTSKTLREWIGDTAPLAWPDTTGEGRVMAAAPDTLVARAPSPLFPRLDEAAQNTIVQKVAGDAAATAPATSEKPTVRITPVKATEAKASPVAAAAIAATISFDDVMKVELRVGRVLAATSIPKMKKLLHLTVDLGEAQPRSIVAGIAEAYAPEKLAGKQVIVVANLAPAMIRGIRSEGMILAAGDESILGLSALDNDVPPGTRVR